MIPEKTVELWNAFALRDTLGPNTWIWSPPRSVDQTAGIVNTSDVDTSELRKMFLLELKAPYRSNTDELVFDIGTEQLTKYVLHFVSRKSPDVLYILPYPPWDNPPSSVLPTAANPTMRTAFARWAFVVRASHLYRLIRIHHSNSGTNELPKNPTVHLKYPRPIHLGHYYDTRLWEDTTFWDWPQTPVPTARTTLCYRPRQGRSTDPVRYGFECPTLSHFLLLLRRCREPRGLAFRSRALIREYPQQHDPFKDVYRPSLDSSDSYVLDDELPSEGDWPADVDLELTDENLRAASTALLGTTADDRDRDVDGDDRPRPEVLDDDVPAPRNLLAVGMR